MSMRATTDFQRGTDALGMPVVTWRCSQCDAKHVCDSVINSDGPHDMVLCCNCGVPLWLVEPRVIEYAEID